MLFIKFKLKKKNYVWISILFFNQVPMLCIHMHRCIYVHIYNAANWFAGQWKKKTWIWSIYGKIKIIHGSINYKFCHSVAGKISQYVIFAKKIMHIIQELTTETYNKIYQSSSWKSIDKFVCGLPEKNLQILQ